MLWFTGERPRPGLTARARRWLGRATATATTAATALVVRAESALAQGYAPNAGDGPGGPQLQQLVNWGAGMILIGCAGAVAYHAGRWGWGSHQHNMAKVQDGKEGVARAALVAGVVAAAAALVKFATGLGSAIQ